MRSTEKLLRFWASSGWAVLPGPSPISGEGGASRLEGCVSQPRCPSEVCYWAVTARGPGPVPCLQGHVGSGRAGLFAGLAPPPSSRMSQVVGLGMLGPVFRHTEGGFRNEVTASLDALVDEARWQPERSVVCCRPALPCSTGTAGRLGPSLVAHHAGCWLWLCASVPVWSLS